MTGIESAHQANMARKVRAFYSAEYLSVSRYGALLSWLAEQGFALPVRPSYQAASPIAVPLSALAFITTSVNPPRRPQNLTEIRQRVDEGVQLPPIEIWFDMKVERSFHGFTHHERWQLRTIRLNDGNHRLTVARERKQSTIQALFAIDDQTYHCSCSGLARADLAKVTANDN